MNTKNIRVHKMKPLCSFLLSFFILCWNISVFAAELDSVTIATSLGVIEERINAGDFDVAKKLINERILAGNITPLERWNGRLQAEIMDRIKNDFRGEEKKIENEIKRYYPDVTPEQLQKWKDEKALEVMAIDGKECYFHAAAANLFRIDQQARQRKLEKDGQGDSSLANILRENQTIIYSKAKQADRPESHVTTISVTYTLTVPPDTIPEGEVIRCWLPYPHRKTARQSFRLRLSETDRNNIIISPPENEHSSIYDEKIAEKGKPTVFRVQFQYESTGVWFDLKKGNIKPYDKESELYKKYTAERETHVIFTDKIKNLSEKIVGTEKEPVVILQKIYDWVTTAYPWASSREYSTMRNIPSYVIENGHGDCGMLALTLITLCRYNGIPAKWQSGFMMHPGHAGMHDWAEVYFEGIGWVPVDPSLGARKLFDQKEEISSFFMSGIDSYRLIVNEDYSSRLYPAKIYPRSETVDFQRGEVEWRGGNLYFGQWDWQIDVEYPK